MHPQYKVVCIGDIGVGKTSILGRCRNSSFHDLTATTIACDVIIVKFEFKSESVSLCLWDTAGTERYSSLNSNYFKNSLGAMVIVSAQQQIKDSIKSIRKRLQEYTSQCQNQNIFIIFNKMDLVVQQKFKQKLNGYEHDINDIKNRYDIKGIYFISAKYSEYSQIKNICFQMCEIINKKISNILQPKSIFLSINQNQNLSIRSSKIHKKQCC